MMVKRKLDGAVDESSDVKIWRPVPSGTGLYGRQNLGKA